MSFPTSSKLKHHTGPPKERKASFLMVCGIKRHTATLKGVVCGFSLLSGCFAKEPAFKKNLNKMLISEGHPVKYLGGKK